MVWFERVVFSDKKLLIWRAMAFWKAELFCFRTSHRSTKSHKIFDLFWGRFGRSTQNGRDIPPLAGKLLRLAMSSQASIHINMCTQDVVMKCLPSFHSVTTLCSFRSGISAIIFVCRLVVFCFLQVLFVVFIETIELNLYVHTFDLEE